MRKCMHGGKCATSALVRGIGTINRGFCLARFALHGADLEGDVIKYLTLAVFQR